MHDPFDKHQSGLESPPTRLFQIQPDDAADLPQATRALNAAQGGAVRVTSVAGDVATLYVAAGCAFPVRVRRVWATGTTATGLVGLG
ncbi:spike base protein, RCAP_Rcc01079 family [Limimaricola litoreus]|uniref:Uncharacterized protein n=1 Tax=Limimaricola litoreus TaxID=2955316 RepID=A0A9X2FWD4_9RHOB|nr:hypothetical protein [Limimaricola litoreus]MCP1168378.1 hypothetical protein [Limimaricola litoreus]